MTLPDQESGDPVRILGGRYRLEKVIGQGGMAVVYRGHDETLDRSVAVKVFHAGLVDIARQEAEQGVLASLEHHNLVSLLDAGVTETNGRPERFIVMPFVAGQNLEERLSAGPLAARHVAEIGYDLAEALDYITAHGIIHRDLKPSNILLVDYGNPTDRARAKLTDFGIALADDVERLTADGMTTGTAAYLSPEQARGAHVGPASDVYSLGLVLLQCFTRRREFPGSLVESAVARLSRDPVVPEPLPAHWRHALTVMTAQDPAARPVGPALVALLRDVVLAETAASSEGFVGGIEAASAAAAPSTSASATTAAHPAALDTLPGEALERLTTLAARLFDAPIGLLNVIDDDRVWSHSYFAEGVDDAARNIAFDPASPISTVPVVIPDGTIHPEMRNSPLVTGSLGLRFYISVPVTRHDGQTIGTLSVLDVVARSVTEGELANLEDLAALAASQLELRQESLRTTSDALSLGDWDQQTQAM
ncbi:GAF domain-containing serine/threonine-protein kinase [Frondihabitans sp. VKM Ac-2883]|uniref:protein kinase domain-containing protein n=1 Tax=Frondihabitans sp. VKM Ac-2883 TaxID=2783823 RepID=UPI00188A3999|nr:GAF domain-containing serine/threonine-protein kinase [Frondihabitans sp. VKM Ac-2883]MBF4576991.1 protein kinase [Frondihabitans sp. VKM Ac-2883]